jgi:hypothetical protein
MALRIDSLCKGVGDIAGDIAVEVGQNVIEVLEAFLKIPRLRNIEFSPAYHFKPDQGFADQVLHAP